MRGSYQMREWEVPHLTKIIEAAVKEVENNPDREFDFTNMDICPSNISDILETLGYEEEDIDENSKDFWYIFTHSKYPEDAYLYLHVNIDTLKCDLVYEKE